MEVLITDGMMKKSLSVLRSVAPVASRTGVVSSFPHSMAGISRFADGEHQVRRTSPRAYVDGVNEVVERYGYDYVLPVGGWTTNVFSEHRDALSAPIEEVLPGRESMRIAQDKWRCYLLARALDVPVPETVRLDPDGDVSAADSLGFPLVVKAGTESAPRFVEYATSEAELRAAVDDYAEQYTDSPLAQEYLSGEGCGFFALYLDGEPAGSYSHRRIREFPPTGGISACAESILDETLTEYGTRILDALGWNGPVMVEFKRDATGTPHLIEINPKFWGSLDLGIASGLDFPEAMVRYLRDGTRPDFSFSSRRFHWPLSGDIQHAIARPDSTPAIFGDLVSPRTDTNLSATDPLPHLVEGAKAVVSPFLGS
ncbi:carboxylate--amine ligase [Halobellus rufus]|uniref:carboxylate--amine ligase n=1 Tax=Halobellus rufus TaxID=1448860 RepID=UPI000678BEC6|nr:ATP-grasp domain-containing protein [Halobellus rufus]